MKQYLSWGRYPRSNAKRVFPLHWTSDDPGLGQFPEKLLVYGKGRSYGDCCLNGDGILLDSTGLDRFIQFNPDTGVLRCEAGLTLQAITQQFLPSNWFLPVTPGTQFVTVGGAIANDVHGKNHHRAGSFGCHVHRFELLRSDRGRVICSREENPELFTATIGGLGLTGLILWAEIQLKRVSGPWITCENTAFERLDQFFELSAASDRDYEYTVAWVDCISRGHNRGRGIFMRGNHAPAESPSAKTPPKLHSLPGFTAPEALINRWLIHAFNTFYFFSQSHKLGSHLVHYENFFYPLDQVIGWNRLYGQRGFLQYQFVVPYENRDAVGEILDLILGSSELCTLSVLKIFGSVPSPGMLSFPRPGVTFALDFPLRGQSTLDLCNRFDEVVRRSGGAVYPAKDARMSREAFQQFFPEWEQFTRYSDPQFSSDFWRRVVGQRGHA
jgi:FAD/FMN-containing dehydrogenase